MVQILLDTRNFFLKFLIAFLEPFIPIRLDLLYSHSHVCFNKENYTFLASKKAYAWLSLYLVPLSYFIEHSHQSMHCNIDLEHNEENQNQI